MYAVDTYYQRSFGCKARESCVSDLTQTKAATEMLLEDISATPAPSSIGPAARQVQSAAQQFKVQLDIAIAFMRQPDSDYIAALAAPNIHDLDVAVTRMDCWPVAPIEGDHGITCS
jgi:hypothetical protein